MQCSQSLLLEGRSCYRHVYHDHLLHSALNKCDISAVGCTSSPSVLCFFSTWPKLVWGVQTKGCFEFSLIIASKESFPKGCNTSLNQVVLLISSAGE